MKHQALVFLYQKPKRMGISSKNLLYQLIIIRLLCSIRQDKRRIVANKTDFLQHFRKDSGLLNKINHLKYKLCN